VVKMVQCHSDDPGG